MPAHPIRGWLAYSFSDAVRVIGSSKAEGRYGSCRCEAKRMPQVAGPNVLVHAQASRNPAIMLE